MHQYAFYLLLFAFIACLFGSFFLSTRLMVVKNISEKKNYLILGDILIILATVAVTTCVVILTKAFIGFDFSNDYVARYSNKSLALVYRITAVWAGQSGSLLFWLWSIAISGAIFICLPLYHQLSNKTRLYFLVFFMSILAFMLLLLLTYNNPFIVLPNPPLDGNGMNPLLQHPGMVLHPPLLFLGYGGFTIPACLALAQLCSNHGNSLNSEEKSWILISRPIILVAWVLLTSGILLGCWWAYMELGWGGYWAWDPVENASIVPWFLATAFLHTALVQLRHKVLHRLNIFLIGLTTISAFIATYIVRSGVVDSVHGFGGTSIGVPLLLFIIFSTILLLLATFLTPSAKKEREPESLLSRAGIISLFTWFLYALCAIILVATLWPPIIALIKEYVFNHSDTWTISLTQNLTFTLNANSIREVGQTFYNTVCLPLFLCITILLTFCYWSKWEEKSKSPSKIGPVLVATLLGALVAFILWFVFNPMRQTAFEITDVVGFIKSHFTPFYFEQIESIKNLAAPSALQANNVSPLHGFFSKLQILGVLVAGACMGNLIYAFIKQTQIRTNRRKFAAWGTHFAFALIIFGVACSSGVKNVGRDFPLIPNQPVQIGKYILLLNGIEEKNVFTNGQVNNSPLDAMANSQNLKYSARIAHITVADVKGNVITNLAPERRQYTSHPNMVFAEVDNYLSLTTEIYMSFQGETNTTVPPRAHIYVGYNQFISWLWFGCILICIFPLLGLGRAHTKKEAE